MYNINIDVTVPAGIDAFIGRVVEFDTDTGMFVKHFNYRNVVDGVNEELFFDVYRFNADFTVATIEHCVERSDAEFIEDAVVLSVEEHAFTEADVVGLLAAQCDEYGTIAYHVTVDGELVAVEY